MKTTSKLIRERVPGGRRLRCRDCGGTNILHAEKYDAYGCLDCNQWLNYCQGCDPTRTFCEHFPKPEELPQDAVPEQRAREERREKLRSS